MPSSGASVHSRWAWLIIGWRCQESHIQSSTSAAQCRLFIALVVHLTPLAPAAVHVAWERVVNAGATASHAPPLRRCN